MDPVCVHTCPTLALEFGPIEEIGRKKVEKISSKMLSYQSGIIPGMG